MNDFYKNFEAKIIVYANEPILKELLEILEKKYNKKEINYYVEKPLSKREIEVMKLVISGNSNSQIAKKLNITINTVKAHMSRIMDKLAVTDRVQAAVKVTGQNLL